MKKLTPQHWEFIRRYAREIKTIEEWQKELGVKSKSTILRWKKEFADYIQAEIEKAGQEYIEYMNKLRGKAFEKLQDMLDDPDKYDKAVKYILDYAGFNEKQKIEITDNTQHFNDEEKQKIINKILEKHDTNKKRT